MIDNRVTLEDVYISNEYETTTLYFIAPKELLGDKYSDAEHAEISVEFPTALPEARYASVMISPTKYIKDEECYSDYDWCDIDLPYEDIERLIALASIVTKG